MDICYQKDINGSKLWLILPVTNRGKFRWKKRENNTQFGNAYATSTNPFTSDAYLEWQIGYDRYTRDTDKSTILDNIVFTNAKGERKNPYELSEILYLMKECNIISKDDIKELRDKIANQEFLFDQDREIETEDRGTIPEEGFVFHQQDIIYPTYSYNRGDDTCSIEVSIQKQQYAVGVQPMLYVTIPLCCFSNEENLLGKTSKNVGEARFCIDENNKDFILNTFEIFGMCSQRHKTDILAILDELIQ